MQISIDNVMADYLKNKLKGDTWWCAKKIIESIDNAEENEKFRVECPHKWGRYVGKKECCTLCGGYNVGMGEEWTLKIKSKK